MTVNKYIIILSINFDNFFTPKIHVKHFLYTCFQAKRLYPSV